MIHNPNSGGSRLRRLEGTLARLQRGGASVELIETRCRGHAEELAASIGPDEADVIAVAGGDGTINEVVNGLTPASPAVGLVPLGTANVLAHEIGLGLEPERIAETLLHGRPTAIHPGEANGRKFVMMAGAGFDARVVAAVDLRLKRVIGKGAYVLESLHQLASRPLPRLKVTIGAESYTASSVIVANGRRYGGRFIAAPNANLETPDFEICLLTDGKRIGVVRSAVALGLGRLHALSGVRVVTARDLTIEGPDDEPVQGDGDLIATLPARIRVSGETIRLMTPR